MRLVDLEPPYDGEAKANLRPRRVPELGGDRRFQATGTALRTATSLGFTASSMVATIQTMSRNHFYKPMTSFADHRLRQDVYQLPSEAGLLYVKFSRGQLAEFLLLSFKEKEP